MRRHASCWLPLACAVVLGACGHDADAGSGASGPVDDGGAGPDAGTHRTPPETSTPRIVCVVVEGLEGQPVDFALNGRESLTVPADGRHCFDRTLRDGDAFVVVLARQPERFECLPRKTDGTVDGDDVEVAVRCASTDARLGALALTTPDATIDPAFDPETLLYRLEAFRVNASARLVATAAHPDARIEARLEGEAVTIEEDGTLLSLPTGRSALELEVTAENGAHRRYEVEVYRHDERIARSILEPLGSPSGAFFGGSVAMTGSRVAIGAPNAGREDGAVELFERTTSGWERSHYLEPPAFAPDTDPLFGDSVDLSNGWLVVGAPKFTSEDDPHPEGAAFVYAIGGLEGEPQTLRSTRAYFGTTVHVGEGWLFVSGAGELGFSPEPGLVEAYALEAEGWVHRQTLRASDFPGGFSSEDRDRFGASISSDGDRLVIGAPELGESTFYDLDFDNDVVPGGVFIYRRDGSAWIPETRISYPGADDGLEGLDGLADFGRSVVISGSRLYVGAPDEWTADAEADDGGLWVFEHLGEDAEDPWSTGIRIVPPGVVRGDDPDARQADLFGCALAFDGDTLYVGARAETYHPDGADEPLMNGVVYVYEDVDESSLDAPSRILVSPEAGTGYRFGQALDAASGLVVIGEPSRRNEDTAVEPGRAHVFH